MIDLVVDRVNFAYHDTPILTDVSLQVTPGSFNLLVGPSGGGKSTLLKLLAGLYPTFSGGHLTGTLTLNGYDLGKIVPFQRVAHLAYLFQNPNRQFVTQTPFEELRFSLENIQIDPADITARIENALAQVGMTAFAHQSLQTLSGGEQQKIAVAAIIALDADLWLLDEPFANVDPSARLHLIDVIKAAQKAGKTILLADHDWSGYREVVDDIFVMTNGHLQQADAAKRTEILAQTPVNVPIKTPLPNTDHVIIDLHNVTLQNAHRPLLQPTTLGIPAQKRILITGPNGVGKSTLFSALVKLYAYQGTIHLNGIDIAKRKLAQHVKDIALVFQNAEQTFIAMTVQEELTAALATARYPALWSPDRLDAVLTQLNLAHLREHVVYQLSGGQQKKLQVLLMLMTGTPVLLFDEPLAGLDATSQQTLLALIADITAQQNQTVLMISHQLQAVSAWFDYHLHFEDQQLRYVGGAT